MINEALTFLANTLNDHLKDDKVILGSVSDAHKDKVVVTLVNIAEEATLRNVPPIHQTDIKYQHPPLALNLSILVSASFSNYSDSLKYIDKTLSFFDSNNVFSKDTSQELNGVEKLVIDIENKTLTDSSALWQMLGRTYVPSLLYKVRVMTSS